MKSAIVEKCSGRVLRMQIKLVIRTGTAVMFGALFGLNMHHGYLKWNGLGRTSFLDNENLRFDRLMSHPKPEIHTILTAVIAALIVAGLYELVVAGISKLLRPAS
jgi:hypothetical protein